ncbi:MAG: DUF370 domain-containing protein [Candidatus Aenigmarchaeota archaeon]|nr:DUF370 domain-containing protein [Candidatus Aenigmarchaeota archaeon]
MLLHIGNGHMIATKDVVLIADYGSSMSSKDTGEFLEIANEEGFVKDYSGGSPKSFVVTNETVYLSLISSSTLAKRVDFVRNLDV